jgi:hypothetical protein
MLRLGRHYPGKKTWGPPHMNWLMLQKLEHREQRIVLEALLGAVRQESELVERLEQAIRDAVPEWSLAEVVTALQAMRGIDRRQVDPRQRTAPAAGMASGSGQHLTPTLQRSLASTDATSPSTSFDTQQVRNDLGLRRIASMSLASLFAVRLRRLPRPPRSRSPLWGNETVTREQANHNGAMALCCSASSESGKPPCGPSCCCCYPGRSVVVPGLAVALPQPAPADTQLRRCEGAIRSPHRSDH